MGKIEILRLMAGFKKFRDKYFAGEHPLFERLNNVTGPGQSPKTLIIGCSDSRVDPAIITSANPGDLFIVRNVANLVPPYEKGGKFHGVSSAIEFAVVNLKVENVIVLGHRQCGGIRALMLNDLRDPGESFVNRWVSIAQDAKERVMAAHAGEDEESLCRHGELEAIVTSLNNLKTFPFVKQAIDERGLTLMGIYFDLELGHLLEFDDEARNFRSIEV